MLAAVFAVGNFSAFAQESTMAEPEDERVNVVEFMALGNLDLEPYQGKAVFLNFFYEGCYFCMAEMPDIKKIFDAYSRDDLQIILIHAWYGEDERNTKSVISKHGLEELTFFEDEGMKLSRLIPVQYFPTSLFIDQEGYLVEYLFGALSFEEMAEIVENMGVSRVE